MIKKHLLLRISKDELPKFEISKNDSLVVAGFHSIHHLPKQFSREHFTNGFTISHMGMEVTVRGGKYEVEQSVAH